MQELENKLQDLLVTKAPMQIPDKGRENIVKFLPWIVLVGGIFGLLMAWQLYHVASVTDSLNTYYNSISTYYGTPVNANTGVSWLLWVSLLVLLGEALLAFVAFSPLRAQRKSGWNLLYWAALLSLGFDVFYFLAYMSLSSLIFSLIGSVLGFYLLFQIRGHYTAASVSRPAAPAASGSKTDDGKKA